MVQITDISEENVPQQPVVQETPVADSVVAEQAAAAEEAVEEVAEELAEAAVAAENEGEEEEGEEDEEEEEEEEEEEAYATTDDEDEDFDYYDEDESLLDRIRALKDIVPPQRRAQLSSFFDITRNFSKIAFAKTSSFTWAITTSALLLGVPLSLTILAEQQLVEMEKQFQLQGDAGELLAAAPAEEKPATAV